MKPIKEAYGLLLRNWKGPRGLNSWKRNDEFNSRQMTSDEGRMSVCLCELLSL